MCLFVHHPNIAFGGSFFLPEAVFFYKGAQILWLSIYNNAPPSPSHTSNAWNTRTSSHVFFVNIPQSLLNRNSGLQCPEIGSEIPSALGLVLASFSSRMRADEGRENLTWSVPEKLLRKSEWFNIIVIKCTTPALRKKLKFCSDIKNDLPNLHHCTDWWIKQFLFCQTGSDIGFCNYIHVARL